MKNVVSNEHRAIKNFTDVDFIVGMKSNYSGWSTARASENSRRI